MLITAASILLALAVLLRSLRNGFYLVHIACVLGILWVFPTAPAKAFSSEALLRFLMLHLLCINSITFIIFAFDKHAAKRQGWRVPERTLHSFALIGGTPAAFLAQKLWRHKTRKSSFKAFFWLIFLLQALVVAGLGVAHSQKYAAPNFLMRQERQQ